jgi:hypothetical protein
MKLLMIMKGEKRLIIWLLVKNKLVNWQKISEIIVVTTLSLAPMSVMPDYQKKGIGGVLINSGLLSSQGVR